MLLGLLVFGVAEFLITPQYDVKSGDLHSCMAGRRFEAVVFFVLSATTTIGGWFLFIFSGINVGHFSHFLGCCPAVRACCVRCVQSVL